MKENKQKMKTDERKSKRMTERKDRGNKKEKNVVCWQKFWAEYLRI